MSKYNYIKSMTTSNNIILYSSEYQLILRENITEEVSQSQYFITDPLTFWDNVHWSKGVLSLECPLKTVYLFQEIKYIHNNYNIDNHLS